ncbi:MAG TPA: GNAT family N-acetyltransferase [Gemmatimonadales bacterium]|nr:GNAT family N-acetyltransferase [Gemmatimonadales bacterium]
MPPHVQRPRVRRCRAADLALLEWDGRFTEHREIIRATFAQQRRREALMLVADVGGYPAGQVWLDFTRHAGRGRGLLWAVRVHPQFLRRGLGTLLVAAAERRLSRRGFDQALAGVETWNRPARVWWERLGYRLQERCREPHSYATPDGRTVHAVADQWMLTRPLDLAWRAERGQRRRADGTACCATAIAAYVA